MKNIFLWIVILLIIVLGGYYLIKEQKGIPDEAQKGTLMTKDESATAPSRTSPSNMSTTPGAYEIYAPEKLAKAKEGVVILFFRASWCPTCRALDSDIRTHLNDIPSEVTILDVDYDNSSILKQKYGVTYQHTLVQVNADGSMIKKWNGSPTLSSLVGSISNQN
jgi:thiol-disulfide isomerase/thioredoxin